MSDIRPTSYDAASARPMGYAGTIDEALEQIRVEEDSPVRAWWPLNMTPGRHALLGFLGLLRPSMARLSMRRSTAHEDWGVEYGTPDTDEQVSRWSLEYAQMRGWL